MKKEDIKDYDLKLKLWALSGLIMNFEMNGFHDCLTFDEKVEFIEKSSAISDETNDFERFIEMQALLNILFKETMGDDTDD